jgi:hypothetical protein
MVVAARADLIYATVGRLRSFAAEWTALGLDSSAGWKTPPAGSGLVKRTGPRISGEIQGGLNGWNMPTRALVLAKAAGPNIGDDYTMGIKHTRLQAKCYGATGAEADGVWGLLDAILVPNTGARDASFELHGCRISNIVPESDAAGLRELETQWPFVTASYLVTWMSAP